MHAPATLAPPEADTPTQCPHTPPCPTADAPDAQAAHVAVGHYDQGWSLLCNGLVLFEDGKKLPSSTIITATAEGNAS